MQKKFIGHQLKHRYQKTKDAIDEAAKRRGKSVVDLYRNGLIKEAPELKEVINEDRL